MRAQVSNTSGSEFGESPISPYLSIFYPCLPRIFPSIPLVLHYLQCHYMCKWLFYIKVKSDDSLEIGTSRKGKHPNSELIMMTQILVAKLTIDQDLASWLKLKMLSDIASLRNYHYAFATWLVQRSLFVVMVSHLWSSHYITRISCLVWKVQIRHFSDGLTLSNCDHSMSICISSNWVHFLLVYVNNILISGSDDYSSIRQLKNALKPSVEMRELGKVTS